MKVNVPWPAEDRLSDYVLAERVSKAVFINLYFWMWYVDKPVDEEIF